MKFAFVGAGAMGSLIGIRLHEAGHEVCFLELAELTKVGAPHISTVYACTKLLDTRVQEMKHRNATENRLRSVQ